MCVLLWIQIGTRMGLRVNILMVRGKKNKTKKQEGEGKVVGIRVNILIVKGSTRMWIWVVLS